MTEFWVSQGNKWCEFCKIYIANNPVSIRTHELGQRHKDNVSKRLSSMRKETAAKEKEKIDAEKALEQIEEKAKRSYQKDIASFTEARRSTGITSALQDSAPNKAVFSAASGEWEYDSASGYYYNLACGYHYDPQSCLYYSSSLGKWVKQEEAFPSSRLTKSDPSSSSKSNVKGASSSSSSVAVNKRKRDDKKPKAITKEEDEALKAREAARKRVEDREKPLLGLYRSY